MSVIRILLSLLVLLPIPGHASTTYTFRFFEVCPGCSTGTGGINNSGIAGAADNASGQGYLYDGTTSQRCHRSYRSS